MKLHIDIDCFFASAHRINNPKLYNIPIAVGGRSNLNIFDRKKQTRKISSIEGAFTSSILSSNDNMTSDEYFKSISEDINYDIIFIDGLHHDDQVLKDIENSLNHLSENGTIVCHDCLPTTEKMQERNDHSGEWTGDVWKAIAELRVERIDLDIKVVDTDYGCGIIRKGTNIPYITNENYKTYTYYSNNKNELLNVISTETLTLWINSL